MVALQRLGGPPGPFVGGGVELVPWSPTQRALLGPYSADSQGRKRTPAAPIGTVIEIPLER